MNVWNCIILWLIALFSLCNLAEGREPEWVRRAWSLEVQDSDKIDPHWVVIKKEGFRSSWYPLLERERAAIIALAGSVEEMEERHVQQLADAQTGKEHHGNPRRPDYVLLIADEERRPIVFVGENGTLFSRVYLASDDIELNRQFAKVWIGLFVRLAAE